MTVTPQHTLKNWCVICYTLLHVVLAISGLNSSKRAEMTHNILVLDNFLTHLNFVGEPCAKVMQLETFE